MRYIVATHNPKKLIELSRILQPLGIDAVTDRDLGRELPEVEETGTTFEQNAYLKAASACKETGLPAIADDSGLMVDALDGAPGVYSARYAGEGATDADRIQKLLHELQGVPADKRGAHFVSAVCCVFPNGDTLTARGECPGVIGDAPRGEGGFGYDPVFVVEDGRSYAELSAEEKDAISHRGRALRAFREKLAAYLEGDDTVSKLLLHFTYDVDLLEVPERIAAYPRKYQKAFDKWMHNKDNDHGYWVVEDGRKKGVCYGSDAFVEFINTQLLETGEEKAKVIEENLSTYDHDLPMLYF